MGGFVAKGKNDAYEEIVQYEYADVHPVVGRQTGSFERIENRD